MVSESCKLNNPRIEPHPHYIPEFCKKKKKKTLQYNVCETNRPGKSLICYSLNLEVSHGEKAL